MIKFSTDFLGQKISSCHARQQIVNTVFQEMPRGGLDVVSSKTCRDCGYAVEPTARGCPRCALNIEAESMIDRFVWRWFIPGVIIVAGLAVAALFYLLR